MNAASIHRDVIRLMRVEYSQLKTDNRSAARNTSTLLGLISFFPTKLISVISGLVSKFVADRVASAVARLQTHTYVFRALKAQLEKDGPQASSEEKAIVLSHLMKLEAFLLESIPTYSRTATALRELSRASKVAQEFDRMVGATEELYLLVLDVHHIFIGAAKTIGRSWEAAVSASQENFKNVVAGIAADEEETDPELLALATYAAAVSEQKGRTDDTQWAKNLAKSPLH